MDKILTTLAAETKNVIDPVKVGTDQPSSTQLTTDIGNILNIVIGSLGLVAVVVVVIGGINYITSSGDAGKVDKAKKTILYGVIGLVICALAAAIVNFTIGAINSAANDAEAAKCEGGSVVNGQCQCSKGQKLVEGKCVKS